MVDINQKSSFLTSSQSQSYYQSYIAPSRSKSKYIDNTQFTQKACEANTLIDTFFLLGPKLSDPKLLEALEQQRDPSKRKLIFEAVNLKPQILGQFPEFSRKKLDLDSANRNELISQAFPFGFKVIKAKKRPQSQSISGYQFGSDRRIYSQYFVFYEALDQHVLCGLEQQLQQHRLREKNKQVEQQEELNLHIPQEECISELSYNSDNKTRSKSCDIIGNLPFDDLGSLFNSSDNGFQLLEQDTLKQTQNWQVIDNFDEAYEEVRKADDLLLQSQQSINFQNTSSQLELDSTPKEPLQAHLTVEIKKYLDRMRKIQNDLLNEKKDKLWLPKCICICSQFQYYDFFDQILKDLNHRLIKQESSSLLEQHLFNIVFRIPAPLRSKQTIFYPMDKQKYLEISLPSIEDLPFANNSHFQLLLQHISIEDIVTIFTHMLFEQKTLLICPDYKMLLPIAFALHSLIYPFHMSLFIPSVVNDGEDSHNNNINLVSNPMNYFIGICQQDKEEARSILEDDDFSPPLIIDIEQQQLNKHKVDFSFASEISKFSLSSGTTLHIIKKCLKVIEDGQWIDYSSRRNQKDQPFLPSKSFKQLMQKIEKAQHDYPMRQGVASSQYIMRFRQAFFDVIVELFFGFKKRVQSIEGETIFDTRGFIEDSDPAFRDFFHRFLQLEPASTQSNNQMFNNFIQLQAGRSQQEMTDEERIMVEHFKSATSNQSEKQEIQLKREQSFQAANRLNLLSDEEKYTIDEVKACPIGPDELIQLYSEQVFLPFQLSSESIKLKYKIFPVPNPSIFKYSSIVNLDQIVLEQKLKVSSQVQAQQRDVKLGKDTKEGIYVYICWIYMWCFTLTQQDEREHIFRTNQLKQVIGKLKADFRFNLKTDLFYLLMDACYTNGNYKTMQEVYSMMQRYEVPADNRIKLMLFEQQREDLKQTQEREKLEPKDPQKRTNVLSVLEQIKQPSAHHRQSVLQQQPQPQQKSKNLLGDKSFDRTQKDEQILDPTSQIYKRVFFHFKFRKRTFKLKNNDDNQQCNWGDLPLEQQINWDLIIVDQAKIKLKEKCRQCGGQLLAPQLKRAIERAAKENKEDMLFICTFCGKNIDPPQLRVTLGRKLSHHRTQTSFDDSFNFLSAEQLYQEIQTICLYEDHEQKKQGEQIPLWFLRKEKEMDFWNLVYYFDDYKLPFEFILPYEEDQFKPLLDQYRREQKKSVNKTEEPF